MNFLLFRRTRFSSWAGNVDEDDIVDGESSVVSIFVAAVDAFDILVDSRAGFVVIQDKANVKE